MEFTGILEREGVNLPKVCGSQQVSLRLQNLQDTTFEKDSVCCACVRLQFLALKSVSVALQQTTGGTEHS